jgi:hypothetical protein
MRLRAASVALVVSLPRVLWAQAAPPTTTPASDAAAPSAPPDAANEAQGAAALRAAQELEARLIEVRRELDALERERASFDDLRRRLDELEARQAAMRSGATADWTSVPGLEDAVRFSRDGVLIRSPGNRFLLRPGVRLQGIYELDVAKAGTADPEGPGKTFVLAQTFSLAHAELLFEGHAFDPSFEYRLELDFGETLPQIAKDAFVQWRPLRSFALRVGQFKVPYGLETQYWNALLELVDVSQATAAFSLGRDVGVMALGRPLGGRLQASAAATAGPRGCPPDTGGLRCDQVDLAYAARVVAAPFGPLPPVEGDLEGQRRPLLSVGASGAYLLQPTDVRNRTMAPNALLDLDQNGRVDNVEVWQGALELRALWRGASLQAEWLGRHEHPGIAAPDRSFWGAYGQAGYFVLPGMLQLVARFGRTDLPLYGVTATERALRGSRTTEAAGGVSYYLHGHDAKVQVDYTHQSTRDAESAPTVNRIRAAVQLAFF